MISILKCDQTNVDHDYNKSKEKYVEKDDLEC